MTKNPNRDKSQEELDNQGEILRQVRGVMIKHGLKPIFSDGLVLGYVREHDFIKWDFDADFFVNAELAIGKEYEILYDLVKLGFEEKKVRRNLHDWKVAVEKNDYHIDLRAFYRDGDNHISRVRRSNGDYSVYTMPARFMDNLQEVEFYGATYFIPKDTDGYLTHLYGDWRTPIRSCKHSEYLNPNFKKVVKDDTGKICRTC
jgi:hypothetical protein